MQKLAIKNFLGVLFLFMPAFCQADSSANSLEADFSRIFLLLENGNVEVLTNSFRHDKSIESHCASPNGVASLSQEYVYISGQSSTPSITALRTSDWHMDSLVIPGTLPTPTGMPSYLTLLFSPNDETIYYKDWSKSFEKHATGVGIFKVTEKSNAFLNQLDIKSRTRVRVSASGDLFASLTRPFILCRSSDGRILKTSHVRDVSRLKSPGDFLLHGAEFIKNSATLTLWITRLTEDGKERTEQAIFDWEQDKVQLLENIAPWPDKPLRLVGAGNRNTKLDVLWALNRTGIDTMPVPVLNIAQAKAFDRLRVEWLGEEEVSKSYLTPSGRYVLLIRPIAKKIQEDNVSETKSFTGQLTAIDTTNGAIAAQVETEFSITDVIVLNKTQ